MHSYVELSSRANWSNNTSIVEAKSIIGTNLRKFLKANFEHKMTHGYWHKAANRMKRLCTTKYLLGEQALTLGQWSSSAFYYTFAPTQAAIM